MDCEDCANYQPKGRLVCYDVKLEDGPSDCCWVVVGRISKEYPGGRVESSWNLNGKHAIAKFKDENDACDFAKMKNDNL
uniref:Uncharacterized protein n=1 Tax=viral metagenome TaxID=1070528 RepID=A0A6M3LN98_9ZZZZ